jgi:hypothetical protein
VKYRVALDQPLGAWYKADRHIVYDAYRTKNIICRRQVDAGVSLYDRYIEDGIMSNFYIQDGFRPTLPRDAHPIDITICGERIQACNPYTHAIDESRERKQKGDEENEETEESELQVYCNRQMNWWHAQMVLLIQ